MTLTVETLAKIQEIRARLEPTPEYMRVGDRADALFLLGLLPQLGAGAPPSDNDASRAVRDAGWQVVKEYEELGFVNPASMRALDRELGRYDSPGRAARSSGTGKKT